MAAPKTRLRKKCPDCGTRGNWPKKILNDCCPECTSKRKHHAEIQRQFHERCERVQDGKHVCSASSKDKCASCVEYYRSDTRRFWLSLR